YLVRRNIQTMQLKLTILTSLFIGSFTWTGCQSSTESSNGNLNSPVDTTWAILPFNKVDSVNPVLLPGDGDFLCPILGRTIRWEEKDVFNPAAVVRDGKVHLLFRAEDKIGKHAGTSRIGL